MKPLLSRNDLTCRPVPARLSCMARKGWYWCANCRIYFHPLADPSGHAPTPAGNNENHAHGEAGRASQSGPSENHIGLDSSRLNPAGRSDHLTEAM